MTVVEFFDRSPIENMVSTFAHQPERVVLVGQSSQMKKQGVVLQRFLAATGNSVTQLEYRGVKVHELSEIVRVLVQIVEDYPGCCFDLTGGDDLTMVAIGIVFERYRERGLELHQYNIRTGRVYDCDLDGNVLDSAIPSMTVEQSIILHGGSIVPASQLEDGWEWEWDPDFLQDVDRMWKICRENPSEWNAQINMLDEVGAFAKKSQDSLDLVFHIETATHYFQRRRGSYYLGSPLRQLREIGVLTRLEEADGYCLIRFKNQQIRRCLTKAGTILELKVCLTAKALQSQDGAPYFNDVRVGVSIDWDGVLHREEDPQVDTTNEIDVILMRGLIPVFLSCKNGAVDAEELYKLNTVANRFGGKYVRKVLVASTLGKNEEGKRFFLQRALDMKITVLTGVHRLSEKELGEKLRGLA